MRQPVDLGSRAELFIDDFLIEQMRGASLRLHPPEKREVVLTFDRPWENEFAGYLTALRDGEEVRLYYRGMLGAGEGGEKDQNACCAASADGVRFERPALGLFEFRGSRDNNIIWTGQEAHNLAPFLDANPAATPEARYKAIARNRPHPKGGRDGEAFGLVPFASEDGIRWRRTTGQPVITSGLFDSQNLAFWDARAGLYRCYSRYFTGGPDTPWEGRIRAIQSCTSADFHHWTEPVPNVYDPPEPDEHYYTNATVPCPGAEHILLSFPMRFVPHRTKIEGTKRGVSDAVLMTSRDGVRWDRRFREAWVRPGPDPRCWVNRNNMPGWGVLPLVDHEFTMYISEGYNTPRAGIRRLVVPRHRFASVNAGFAGGEFVTKPLVFTGRGLSLNYATSAAGLVRVEIQDAGGRPLAGYGADACELFGDELDAVVLWEGRADVAALAGTPVRLRFVLKDADVFALRFAGT